MVVKIIHSNGDLNNKNSYSIRFQELRKIFKKTVKEKELFVFIQSVCEFLKINKDLIFCFESSLHCIDGFFKEQMLKIILKMKKGTSVSSAFAESHIFPEYFVSLVKIGEKNNNFEETFSMLKEFINWKIKQNNKFFHALLYPLVTFSIFSCVLFLFADYIIPSILEVSSINDNSNIKMFLNSLFAFKACIIFSILNLISLFVLKIMNFELYQKIIFSIPFVGKFLIYKEIYFLSYSLYSATKSSIPLMQSLVILSETTKGVVKEVLLKIKNDIAKGSKLSSAISSYKFIPEVLVNVIKTGENSSNLLNSFLIANTIFESKYKDIIEKMIIIIPIILIAFISILMILFVSLVFIPIYNVGF